LPPCAIETSSSSCGRSSSRFENVFDVRIDHEPNGNDLTDREVEILAWVARGKTNQEIAALLVVSPHTVRKHLEHAFKKLRVHTRAAAVARVYAPMN
jgi:DNA-binding CsgD family transcriptional regulator